MTSLLNLMPSLSKATLLLLHLDGCPQGLYSLLLPLPSNTPSPHCTLDPLKRRHQGFSVLLATAREAHMRMPSAKLLGCQ